MSKSTRSSSGQTPLSERSCFNEVWVLPPVREEYLRAHTSTRLAQLHSSQDPNIIKPSWLKVSSTPLYGIQSTTCLSSDEIYYFYYYWYCFLPYSNQSANLRSGYGVKIEVIIMMSIPT